MNGQIKDNRLETVAVLGAGIAGLTAAWKLYNAGSNVTVLEQSSSVGGCIRTVREKGYLLELGPNTFLNSSRELWELAGSAGLEELKIETKGNIGRTRYIFKSDRLIKVPAGPNILFSPILSAGGRLRLLKEPFIRPLAQKLDLDESLASFMTRRFGREVLETIVTPFISGIYAGDPEKLSMKAVFPKLAEIEKEYGSIFRGIKHLKKEIGPGGLGSFQTGIGTLASSLGSRMKGIITTNARVVSVERLHSGYKIRYEHGGEIKSMTAEKVVSALPAYSAAKLFAGMSDDLGRALAEIEYAPVVVVHTGHKEEDVRRDLDGFGYLVPRKNRVRQLGCLWSSSLFHGRAPRGRVLLTSFLGGMLDPEAIDLTNEDLMRIVLKDLERTLGIKGRPDLACVTKYTHAIPQYNIGHVKRITRIDSSVAGLPGLYLTGSYFEGISVAGTIEHANRTALRVLKQGGIYGP